MNIDPQTVTSQIERFIQEKVQEFQRDGVVFGMSGGIDSAVVGNLLTRSLGREKVLALLLPERDSSLQSKTDALLEIERLGIAYREVPITPMLEALGIYRLIPLHFLGIGKIQSAVVRQQHRKQAEALGETPFSAGLLGTRALGDRQKIIDLGNAYARAKHRCRLVTLYYVADQENCLVVGTTNKSEASSGFVVKWGDNAADIEPILPLYKTQVRQLAAYLGVSPAIIAKPPSPDLLPGIVDEFALGIDYATLDKIYWGMEHGLTPEAIIAENGVPLEQIRQAQQMFERSRHLRELPQAPELVFN